MTRAVPAVCLVTLASGLEAGPRRAPAPAGPAPNARAQALRGRAAVPVDEEPGGGLNVSNKPADQAARHHFDAGVKRRTPAEARYAQASRGVVELTLRSPKGSAAR